jgi:Leucine-rich repeat (LRR) protein
MTVPPNGLLQLQAQKALSVEPQLFRGFGAHDLTDLTLGQGYWNDQHITYISKLTGLRLLIIDQADVHDKSIPELNQLTNLKVLSIRGTSLTGNAVAQLKVLERLRWFGASLLDTILPVLQKLNNSQTLEYLQLDGCKLTNDDMKAIATMSNLQQLRMSGNHQLTDSGLQLISHLRKLHTMAIDGDAVSAKCIETLKKLPSLKNLSISSDEWSKADQAKLHEALPNCHCDTGHPDARKEYNKTGREDLKDLGKEFF